MRLPKKQQPSIIKARIKEYNANPANKYSKVDQEGYNKILNARKQHLDNIYSKLLLYCDECTKDFDDPNVTLSGELELIENKINRLPSEFDPLLEITRIRSDFKPQMQKFVEGMSQKFSEPVYTAFDGKFRKDGALTVEEKVRRNLWTNILEENLKAEKEEWDKQEYSNENIIGRLSGVVEKIYNGDIILPGLNPDNYKNKGDSFRMAEDIVKACGAYTFTTPKERKENFFFGGTKAYKQGARNDESLFNKEGYFNNYFNEESNKENLKKHGLGFLFDENDKPKLFDKDGTNKIFDLNISESIIFCNGLRDAEMEKTQRYEPGITYLPSDRMPNVAVNINRKTDAIFYSIRTVKNEFLEDETNFSLEGFDKLQEIDKNKVADTLTEEKKNTIKNMEKEYQIALKNELKKSIENHTKKINAYELRTKELANHFDNLFKAAKTVNSNWTKETMLDSLMDSIAESENPQDTRQKINSLTGKATAGFFEKLMFWTWNKKATQLNTMLDNLTKKGNESIDEDELKQMVETANALKDSIEGNKKFNGKGKKMQDKIKNLSKLDQGRYELAIKVLEGVDANMKKKISDTIDASSQSPMMKS